MKGLDGVTNWKNIKRRLSFKGLGCCGATWSPRTILDETEEEPIMIQQDPLAEQPQASVANAVGHVQAQNSANSTDSVMNLAMALAAERNLRDANVGPGNPTGGQVKTSMTSMAETDVVDWRKTTSAGNDRDRNRDGGNANDWLCCVCMGRNKVAAFIPCGHAYCRVCSRDLWVNRGFCPICNRSILQILDIF